MPAHVTLQDGGRATTALTLTLDLPVDATVGDLRTTAARALSLTLESFLVRNFDGGVLESEEQRCVGRRGFAHTHACLLTIARAMAAVPTAA